MRVIPCLALLAVASMAVAGTDAPRQSRKPTAAELSSFGRFFHRAYPDETAPPLTATRSKGERRWVVESAGFELRPARAAGGLCTADVVQFRLDRQWQAFPLGQQSWIDGPGCTAQGGRVRRANDIADGDVVALLRRQQAVLARARLLMAGNSDCAKERSSRFALSSIPGQAEKRFILEFRSDRPVVLTAEARQAGADYDVWTVHCAYVQGGHRD